MSMNLDLPCCQWREGVDSQRNRGEKLERIAHAVGLTHFDARVTWCTPTLDSCQWHNTLEEFCDRVKEAAKILGRAPDTCKGDAWGGQYTKDQAPDLVATWKMEHDGDTFDVIVRSFSPKGCKVDPRTDFVEKKEQELHPECVSVLSELEDMEL